MEAGQAEDGDHQEADDADGDDRDKNSGLEKGGNQFLWDTCKDELISPFHLEPKWYVHTGMVCLSHLRQPVPVVQHVYQAQHEYRRHVHGQRDEEHEEVSVVPPADAVVDPGAVMVKDLDAVVAD